MQNQKSVDQIVNEIFGLFDKYDESVTQLEHVVQSAQLAAGEGYEDEVILAALFHDIGHSVDYFLTQCVICGEKHSTLFVSQSVYTIQKKLFCPF